MMIDELNCDKSHHKEKQLNPKPWRI